MKIKLELIYAICLVSTTLVNMDHGIIPACSLEIQSQLRVEEMFVGFLGSMVFMGIMLGSLASGIIFSQYSCKKVLLVSMIGLVVGFIFFPLTSNKAVMAISRFITGFFQAFLIVFFPIWIDVFGKDHKTSWLSYLQLCTLLGVIFGYVLTGVFNVIHFYIPFISWRCSFYTQSFLLIGAIYLIHLSDERDLATNSILSEEYKRNSETFDNYPVLRYSLYSRAPSLLFDRTSMKMTFEPVEDIVETDQKEESPLKENFTSHGPVKPFSIREALGIILYKRLYLVTMLTLCSMFFVITVEQFWMSHYLINVLNARPSLVFFLFTFTSLTAPSGLIIGSYISEKIGGYESPNALLFCLIVSVLGGLAGIPLPLVNSYWAATFFLWLQFFFGSAIMPTLIGLMISSVGKQNASLGNALAQFTFNLLGYIPAPLCYGWIVAGRDKSRSGMGLVAVWGMYPVILLGYGYYKKQQKLKLEEKKKELEQKKKDLEMLEMYKETKQKEGKFKIPLYEDFDKQNELKQEVKVRQKQIEEEEK